MAAPLPSNSGSYLREPDHRVASTAYRLAISGRHICPGTGPQSGIAFHHLAEYSAENRALLLRSYRLDRGPGILAVVAGSPAARAGLRAGDILISVDSVAFPSPLGIAAVEDAERRRVLMLSTQRHLEDRLLPGPVTLSYLRDGREYRALLEPQIGCPMRARLANSDQLNAFADGANVTVTSRLLSFLRNDDELAIVLAHELAHNLLGHADALQQADVPGGFFRRIGRNGRRVRQTEEEADRFAVRLIVAAGFDPRAGLDLWQRLGQRSSGLRLFPTHPGSRARARQWIEAMAAEGVRVESDTGGR